MWQKKKITLEIVASLDKEKISNCMEMQTISITKFRVENLELTIRYRFLKIRTDYHLTKNFNILLERLSVLLTTNVV